MKSAIAIILIIVSANISLAQLATENNHTGTWIDGGSWSTAQPSPLTTGIVYNGDITVEGFITREGALTFGNQGKNSNQFIVNDTLVVNGNLSFDNNSHSLVIGPNGLLVVFGDLLANNKVVLDNGGILAVIGDLTLNGGKQEYTGTGALYVDGVISGNGDVSAADAVDEPSSNLNGGSTEEQGLYDFIQNNGATSLPIKLGAFSLSSIENKIQLSWTTLFEENFDYFEIQRSQDGVNFSVIGTVKGAGFSTQKNDYKYVDLNPMSGKTFYRLNAVDYDGSNEVFDAKSVEHKADKVEVNISKSMNQRMVIRIDYNESPQQQEVVVYTFQGKVLYHTQEKSDVIEIPLNTGSGQVFIVKVRVNNVLVTKKVSI